MTSRDLGFVLLRGFGLLMLIEAALGLPSTIQAAADSLASPKPDWLFSTVVSQLLIRLGIGAFLMVRSPSLADRLFSGSSNAIAPSTALFQSAIGTLGVYFAASGLIEMASQVYVALVLRSMTAGIPRAAAENQHYWGVIGLSVIRILVGLALVALSNRIATSWSALRQPADPSSI